MQYAIEMGSDAMTYIPSFMKTALGIHTHRYTRTSAILFPQRKLGQKKKKKLSEEKAATKKTEV
jgi:hypothetical protein